MYTKIDASLMKEKSSKLRCDILNMLCEAGSGHSGGSLSAIDVMNVLYNRVMNHDPKDPGWDGRDRFILSKGHAAPALYAVLADCGYFREEELGSLRKYGSILQGHPYMHKTPGLEVSSGSLGQGMSIAVGIAMAAKMDCDDTRTYCMVGDGETQEGQIWEAIMTAGYYKLDNLCGIVDRNQLQIDGWVKDVMDIEPLADKLRAFRWNVIEVDGHDVAKLEAAFGEAAAHTGQPTMLIANTVKGKGVSFMEGICSWHGAAPSTGQLESALAEIENV